MNNKKIIYSLQGWRAVMMLMIFILHICPDYIKLLAGGNETISFFIVVSGFVLTLGYNTEIETKLKNIFVFTYKRLKKIYPIHMLMLFAWFIMFIPLIIRDGFNAFVPTIPKFIAQSLLVQAFIPNHEYYYSLNGVSWYLSATIFFYIMFIPLSNFIAFVKNKTNIKNIYQYLFVLNIIIYFVVVYLLQGKESFSYITYICPFFRLLEFENGILLALIYKSCDNTKYKKNNSSNLLSVLELLGIILFILDRVVTKYSDIYKGNHNYSCFVATLIVSYIVFVFSFEGGIFSKLISNKLFVFLGEISFEVYIVHVTIKTYVDLVLGHFNLQRFSIGLIVVLTFISAVIFHYKPISKYYKYRKLKHYG